MDFNSSLQTVILDMLCETKYSFYGLFLAEINKSFDDDFPTACVGKHRDSPTINLFIGKHFWEKTLWNNSRKMAILIHEVNHVFREHLTEFSESIFQDKMIANMAMDISINQTITEELPRIDEKGEKCGVYIEDFPKLNLQKDQSSLYYYQQLMKAKEEKINSRGRGEDSKAEGQKKGNKRGTSGDGELDKWLDSQDNGKVEDWHRLWNDLTSGMDDKEREVFKKEIQEMAKRIAEETIKNRGTVPIHIANAIKDNFGISEPVINWKTLFNRFIGSTISTDISQTRKRPNFRFEDAPSNKYKNKIKIVCGLDSSGSVSDEELKEFFGQIKHMWKAGVKIDVCMWDTNVHLEYEYKGENHWKRVCQGGTYASSFMEYVNKNRRKKNWTCAIGLTDGYVEGVVLDAMIPTLWVITKGGSMEFKNKGKKVKIN